MRHTPLVPVLALSAVLLLTGSLAGCGAAPDRVGPSPEPVASGPSGGSLPPVSQQPVPPRGSDPTTIPTRPPASGPPKQPTDVFTPVTLRGTIKITGSCRELVTDTVTWTLLGAAAESLAAGATVEVTGTPSPNLETPCSGSPLRVASVRSR